MVNGAPSLDADELRARPTLEELMPAYAGALDSVVATLLAGAEAGAELVPPGARRDVVEDADEDPWDGELWAEFAGEPTYRGEQVVDGMVARVWDAHGMVEGLIADDDGLRSALREDLVAAVAPYGFHPGSSWDPSEDPEELLRAYDSWGATVQVTVYDDLAVRVDLTTGVHRSDGSEVVPAGDVRPARRPEVGPEAI